MMKMYILLLLSMFFVTGCSRTAYVNAPKFATIILHDKETGLMWKQDGRDPYKAGTYENTKSFCNDSVFGSYDDWRVPSISELVSLIDYTKNPNNPGINSKIKNSLKGIVSGRAFFLALMSSTLNNKGRYWGLNVREGTTYTYDPLKSRNTSIICVRGNLQIKY